MDEHKHCSWIVLGDEWIISYLLNYEPTTFKTVSNFSIAHALECYLKAAFEYKFGIDEVKKERHDLYSILNKLQNNDNSFLPFLKIDKQLYDLYSIESDSNYNLDIKLQKEIILNDYIFFPLKYITDLKYHRFIKAKGPKSYGVIFPENRFTPIFNAIRLYVGFEQSGKIDFLKFAIEEKKIVNFTNNYACENFLLEVVGK